MTDELFSVMLARLKEMEDSWQSEAVAMAELMNDTRRQMVQDNHTPQEIADHLIDIAAAFKNYAQAFIYQFKTAPLIVDIVTKLEHAHADDDILDEEVNANASSVASGLNDGGYYGQVQFLLDFITPEEIMAMVESKE